MKLKTLFGLLVVVASAQTLEAQKYSCRLAGKELTFTLNTTRIIVKFKENYSFLKRNELIGDARINRLDNEVKSPSPINIFTLGPNFSEAEIEKTIQALNKIPEIDFAAPFLNYEEESNVGMTNEIIIKLKSFSDTSYLNKFCSENNLRVTKRPNPNNSATRNGSSLDLIAIVRLPPEKILSCFTMAKYIQQTNVFTYAEPNFIHTRLLNAKADPVDPEFPNQWALPRMNVSGINGAWNITKGITGIGRIKVAVIDVGVELSHPDLQTNMGGGFDATFGSMSAVQQLLGNSMGANYAYDEHGTLCAGVISAAHNTIGIAGVTAYCQIMPVKIGFSQNNQIITDDFIEANGIIWAYLNGADILSNSWSGGTPATILEDAINDAVSLGRHGLGSPVFFAAGNNNKAVKYPARYPKVIAVAATEGNDYRCSPVNWGTNFGSCYGAELDIAAPGDKIISTDLMGAYGSNNSNGPAGNYATVYGTSLACPQAAGVMALILSANGGLSIDEARFVLESTCDKVGSYLYTNVGGYQPNGSWCPELGYGRINAKKAVDLAKTFVPVFNTGFSSCSAQNAEDLMRNANNNNTNASVNFKINDNLTIRVVNVCNNAIYIKPIDRWLFTYEKSNILCAKTKNMGSAAYKVYSNFLKNKCDCRWLRLFIAVQESDENLNLVGPEASQWFYFYDADQSVMLETKSVLTFDLKNYLPNGITLVDGKYYKIKVASFDNGKFTQPWCEHSGYIRVYKDNILIQNKTITHDQFADKITISNATVPSSVDIKVVAKSKINILPNTTLKSGTYKIKYFDCSQLAQFDH